MAYMDYMYIAVRCPQKGQFNHSLTHLAPSSRQAINWTNDDPVRRRIYAALGGDELSPHGTIFWQKYKTCLLVCYILCEKLNYTSIESGTSI